MQMYKVELVYRTEEEGEKETTTFASLIKDEALKIFGDIQTAIESDKTMVKVTIPHKELGEDCDPRAFSCHLVRVTAIMEVNVELEEEEDE